MESDEVTYRWEKNVDSWESVKEDSDGNIVSVSTLERDRSYRAKLRRVASNVRRGLIRYLVVAVDCSSSASEKDIRPCRIEFMKSTLCKFIVEFFDQNPISQLGVIITVDGVTRCVTQLSGNPQIQIERVKKINEIGGDASLQNVLIRAADMLKYVPNYASKELLVMYSALNTRDPGDIFETINDVKSKGLRVSIVSLAAELHICRRIAESTGGTYHVGLDRAHCIELIQSYCIPPPEIKLKSDLCTEFVYLGFPKMSWELFESPGTNSSKVPMSYICPRCYIRTHYLPTQCEVCKLQLYSSSHIARSYHHLFPVPPFEDLPDPLPLTLSTCHGCLLTIDKTSLQFQCSSCLSSFCADCDSFIHESLHNCPGCCNLT